MAVTKERYGPWALIVGGSEGVGEHFARKLGAAGIHLVLVARKPGPLAETAQKVRDERGVQVRTLQLDIARDDMLERIREVTDDVEIGLLIHNVGGGQGTRPFLDQTLDQVLNAVKINAVGQTKLVHHFGQSMVERGRGGILFVGSMAGNAGGMNLATYGASKAFTQIFAEALWAELQPHGVDVLVMVLGATDTPARARTAIVDADEMPVASAEAVAQQALDRLADGPVHVPPENAEFFRMVGSMPRRDVAEMMRNLLSRMNVK